MYKKSSKINVTWKPDRINIFIPVLDSTSCLSRKRDRSWLIQHQSRLTRSFPSVAAFRDKQEFHADIVRKHHSVRTHISEFSH
ncbi:hypothetical protein IF2G_08972 [Cordyceps javanica]|nr:hypothetical protein IF2G_08972 [Cordyceps javanica]